MASKIFALQAYTQSYDWGKLGSSSKAAAYARVATPGFEVDEGKPYAELWMGTHPTLPSSLLNGGGETLGEHLRKNPGLLGDRGLNDLPFLFKVLAIRKALSIQSHPDKEFAERLHAVAPNLYKDPNHKPEMAIALTPFRAMCVFRELQEIRRLVLGVSPERFALGDISVVQEFVDNPSTETFKRFFESIMKADAETVNVAVDNLLRDCARSLSLNKLEDEERKVVELALELNDQFPGDVGIFCAFFLQVIDVAPGEAIFLGAGEPHAYVSGDILEVMATSDNVLRAGLTPKHRDVDNLLASLTWTFGVKHWVTPTPLSSDSETVTYSKVYDPPVPEFSVVQVELPPGEQREIHRRFNGPSIFIVTQGAGALGACGEGDKIALKEGSVVFIGAGVDVTFTSGSADPLVVYRAYYP